MTQQKLEEIMHEQKDFQRNFYNPDNLTEEDKIRLTKEYILCMHRELGEVLNEIPWKLHRANNKVYNVSHVQEELIDSVKFLLNLCIIWGMDADSLFEKFKAKSEIVRQRFDKEKYRLE